jgi:uncharacterized protein
VVIPEATQIPEIGVAPAPHCLPESVFRALATGGGGMRAGRALAAAERSKHLLLLRSVSNSLRREDGPADRTYALLATAHHRNPAAVETLLRHPAVGAWALHALRDLHTERTDTTPLISHLEALAAAASIRARGPALVDLSVRDGTVMLPSLGRLLLPGARTARVVVGAGGTDAIGDNGRTVSIPSDPHIDGPGWQALRRITVGLAGSEIELLVDDLDPCRLPGTRELSRRLTEPELRRWRVLFDGAWELLTRLHRTTADEIREVIRVLTPLAARVSSQLGASSRDAFGCVAMSMPADSLTFAVTLAHEVQHNKLCGLQDVLSLSGVDDGRRYYVPWREDPRPLGGVLQGTYAFLGVAGFWRRQHRAETGTAAHHAAVEFARWRTAVHSAVRTLEESGRLTSTGLRFVGGMRKTVTVWMDEPVPEHARNQAREVLDRHRRRWVERNVP